MSWVQSPALCGELIANSQKPVANQRTVKTNSQQLKA
jgi:hypothetical protein